jgi:hypothetical protein
MAGAVAFGVVAGTPDRPIVSYLAKPLPVDDDLLALTVPVRPTEVFRFAASCAEGGCQHFDESSCQLVERIASNTPVRVQRLPSCSIRRNCRWWQEQGAAACARCPGIVTADYRPSADLLEAATPK